MRQMVKRLAKRLPPIRRLVRQRDALVRELDQLRHDMPIPAAPAVHAAVAERDALAREVARLQSIVKLNTRPWHGRPLTEAEIADYRARIAAIPWWHSFNLGNGLVINGMCTMEALTSRLENLCIPADLTGHTFLDIGSWDGFYAFEAEQRGAARVLATDSFCWDGAGWGKQAGFLLIREILGSKVEDRHINPLDICPERVGMFDIVLFSGVLYHMREPLTALERAASVASRMLIVETAVDGDPTAGPLLRYLPRVKGNEFSDYWRPSMACITLWLRELGFSRVEHRLVADGPRGFFNAMR